MKSEDKVMGEGLSLHLDIVRVSAALVVVIGHSFGKDISGGWIKIPVVGPDAVMVFFVLSGFVIAFTVEKKDATIGHYICSRLARLWSVLVPALALTIILDYLGMYLFPVFYHNWGTI
jgi:peptidoglycan/LPS O-acetylase OafA/YrhL